MAEHEIKSKTPKKGWSKGNFTTKIGQQMLLNYEPKLEDYEAEGNGKGKREDPEFNLNAQNKVASKGILNSLKKKPARADNNWSKGQGQAYTSKADVNENKSKKSGSKAKFLFKKQKPGWKNYHQTKKVLFLLIMLELTQGI